MAAVSTQAPEALQAAKVVYDQMADNLGKQLHTLIRKKKQVVELVADAEEMVACTVCNHTRCKPCRAILLPSGDVKTLCGTCCELALLVGNSTEVTYCASCCFEPGGEQQ